MKDRLLIIGAPALPKHSLLEHIAPGTYDKDSQIHQLTLKTKYYTQELTVWIDDVDNWKDWTELFQSEEAEPARDVLNGVVVCFSFKDGLESLRTLLSTVESFINLLKAEEDEPWNGVMCCVGFGGCDSFEDYEDVCLQSYWECVDIETTQEWNEFKEPLGKLRLKQCVESNEWGTALEPEEATEGVELETLVKQLQHAREEIGQLPEEERHQRAVELIQSLNLAGLDTEVLQDEQLV